MRLCEGSKSADTKVSEEGRRGGASGAGAEIHLQPMMEDHGEAGCPPSAHGGPQWNIYLPAAHEGPHTKAGGCA